MIAGNTLTLDRVSTRVESELIPLQPGAVADERVTGRARAEWRSFASLLDVLPQWRVLVCQALEPNIFYEPSFALAAADVYGSDAGTVLIWADDQSDRLLGLFPARIEHRRYGPSMPVLAGWTHPYAPYGVPLVDAAVADKAIDAWLDFIHQSDHIVMMPYLRQDGPFSLCLRAALAKRGDRCASFGMHERALLARDAQRRNYLADALDTKKRKELRRQARRLADQAQLVIDRATTAPEIAIALEDFLRLEASGWKGRAHTAALAHASTRAFFKEAISGLAATEQVSITRLRLATRTIAAGIVLRSGAQAWFWKIAYDETYASASPGVQLTLAMTEQLLADASLAQTDSCATAEHPMINRVWRERLPLTDLLIAPSAHGWFKAACRLERLRRRGIAMARMLKQRLRP